MRFDFAKLLRGPDGIRLTLSPRPDRTTHLQLMVAGKNADHTCGPGELRELLSDLVAALGGNKIMTEFDFEAYAEQRCEEAREIDRQLDDLIKRKKRLNAELRIVESACAKLGGLESKPRYKRTPPHDAGPTPTEKIADFLKRSKREVSAAEIAAEIDCNPRGVGIALGKMAKAGTVKRCGTDGFKAAA